MYNITLIFTMLNWYIYFVKKNATKQIEEMYSDLSVILVTTTNMNCFFLNIMFMK